MTQVGPPIMELLFLPKRTMTAVEAILSLSFESAFKLYNYLN